MGFIEDMEISIKKRNFRKNIVSVAQQNDLNILGEVTEEAYRNAFFMRFAYGGQVYSVSIGYHTYRRSHGWHSYYLSGNGFAHVFDYEFLGKTELDVVIKLREMAKMLSTGLLDVPHSNTFSLIERGKKGSSVVGVGVIIDGKTYYLFKSDIIRMNLPVDLLTTSYYSVECFKNGMGYISEWEYERKVQPVKVINDKNLALKILLTVRERDRAYRAD